MRWEATGHDGESTGTAERASAAVSPESAEDDAEDDVARLRRLMAEARAAQEASLFDSGSSEEGELVRVDT